MLVNINVMNQDLNFKNMTLPPAMRRPGVRGSRVNPRSLDSRLVNVRLDVKKRYPKPMSSTSHAASKTGLPILRHELGEVLRDLRQNRGMTLRDVSAKAKVSLGYLSEVERGQKEASSELLASICYALDAPVSFVLREVADRIALQEGVFVPESVPDDLIEDLTPAI